MLELFKALMTEKIIPNSQILAGYNLALDLISSDYPFSSVIDKEMQKLKNSFTYNKERCMD